MPSLKLAFNDPDFPLSTIPSFTRVDTSLFPLNPTINQIFLRACTTAFSHLPNSSSRGLSSTTFHGKDRDSGIVMSVAEQNSGFKWDDLVAEFSPLFSVSFTLYPSNADHAPLLNMFQSHAVMEDEGMYMVDDDDREPPRKRLKLVDCPYAVVESALLQYMEMRGNMRVPRTFVVPTDDESWPEETWGMSLGLIVKNIKRGGYRDKQEELISIGFEFTSHRYSTEAVELALARYREVRGDAKIPLNFLIPHGDDVWPEPTWGMKLGKLANDHKGRNSYASKRRDILNESTVDRTSQKIKDDYVMIKAGLIRYKEKYGNMNLPRKFVVPADDESWPEEVRGYQLGKAAARIRCGHSYKRNREELEGIGFDYNTQMVGKRYGYAVVRSSLLKYKELHGTMLVPQAFVIPYNDNTWPEASWGMKLGDGAKDIRRGDNYKSKQEDLESIGFDYTPQRGVMNSYATIEAALLRYKEDHGDMRVPTSFVVPTDDDSWPEEAWGVKLGTSVMSIRSGNSFKNNQQKLQNIGFDFTIQATRYGYPAIKAALLTYKDKHGDMDLPRCFIVPSDNSWPDETWGMTLGSICNDIRRANNYRYKKEELKSMGFDYRSDDETIKRSSRWKD